MADFGIKITGEGTDALTAEQKNTLLNIVYQLMMLDVTNEASFQNVRVRFNNEPPNPDGITVFSLDTLIATIPHGYDYIPATWMLFETDTNPNFPYGQYMGYIDQPGAGSGALIIYKVDDENIYVYCRKLYQDGLGVPTSVVAGKMVRLRFYVFANDIGA